MVQELIDRVNKLLDKDKIEKALELLRTDAPSNDYLREVSKNLTALNNTRYLTITEENYRAQRQAIWQLVNRYVALGGIETWKDDGQGEMNDSAGKKTILIIHSNPTNTSRLNFAQEFSEIDEARNSSPNDEARKILMIPKAQQSFDKFRRLVTSSHPWLVHISMHGSDEELYFAEDKQKSPVSVSEWKNAFEFFHGHQYRIHGVILSACRSTHHAEAITAYVNYCIGMNAPIPDEAAICFAKAFYENIFDGGTFEMAFDNGISGMKKSSEDIAACSTIPQLFKNTQS